MQNLIIIVLMKNRKAKVEKDHDSRNYNTK